jgi:hypothetical protein
MTEQKGAKLIALLEDMRRDNPLLVNRVDVQAEVMSAPADPEAIREAFQETHEVMLAEEASAAEPAA